MNGRVLIVGAGQAGGRTAQALRRLGHAGPVTLVGDEALPPYERPPLSKEVLLGRAEPASLLLMQEEGWRQLGVELRRSARAVAIEREARRVRLDGGSALDYDHLVLATGARPRVFPGPVEPGTELLYLRTVDDALRLAPRLSPGQRVGIVGAGFIGLELAATARALGAEVTLVEAAPRPLARLLPAAFAFEQIELHRARGVQVLLGQAVERIAPGRIHLADGGCIDVDTIVVGIGACANDELAAAAGLAVRDGIVVDAAGRSSDPAIHAVGDVARHVDAGAGLDHRLESWRNAEDGAQAAAASILGLPPPRPPVPWFWTDQYGRNIQIAGRPDDGHRCVVLDTPDDGPRLVCYLDGSARLRGAIGIDCARELRRAMKLIERGEPVEDGALPVPRARALSEAVAT